MFSTLEPYAPNYLNSKGYSSLLSVVYSVLKERYSIRFPELATFELTAEQYAKVVLLLTSEDETDINISEVESTRNNSSGLNSQKITSSNTGLPNATVMIISVTASSTKGRPFTLEEWKNVREISQTLIEMDRIRKLILKFIESQMESLAPNVTVLVGVEVASQLIGAAGGIIQLSRIPAGNIQVIGRSGRKNLAGLSSASYGIHSGFVSDAPLISEVAPEYKIKAQRLISAKVSIASRVDACNDHRDGGFGRKLYDEIVGKLEKLSEPAPLKMVKPLPIPDGERKKRRGP